MPRTRLLFVNLTAIIMLALLLFFAHFVLTDLDNPFEGSWNLSAEPFAELVSKSSKQIDENP